MSSDAATSTESMIPETTLAGTVASRLLDLVERIGDMANPILVKEVRQALKSRQFVATFLLLLAAAWVVAMFGLLTQADSLEFGSSGSTFFAAFYTVLAVATIVVVPFTTFRSLQTERDADTFELLSITTLSARQIVWGKLLSALVQLFVFYSAITPFIAFTSMLPGFDAPSAAYVLTASMLLSLLLSMAALMLSTLAKTRVTQGLLTLVVLGGLGNVLTMTFMGVGGAVSMGAIAVADPNFWIGTGIMLVIAASYFYLFLQITTAQLMFESANRSTGVRLAVAAQFWLFWLLVLLLPMIVSTGTMGNDNLIMIGVLPVVHWAVAGLFCSTEPDSLSRRVRRRLPQRSLLRACLVPLMPGGARGYLFTLLHLAAHWWLCVALMIGTASLSPRGRLPGAAVPEILMRLAMIDRRAWTEPMRFLTALCLYVVIYLGIGAALGRWLRAISPEIRSAHIRLLTFLVFAAAVIGPFLPRTVGILEWRNYSILDLGNPIATIAELDRTTTRDLGLIMIGLSCMALVSLAVNVPAMLRGIRQVMRPVRPAVAAETGTEAVAQQGSAV